MPHDDVRQRNPDVARERTDVSAYALTAVGISLVLGTIVVLFIVVFYFQRVLQDPRAQHQPPSVVATERVSPIPSMPPPNAPEVSGIPGPQLQPTPRLDLAELRKRDEEILSGKKGGIPIEKAIDMLVEQGLPQTGNYADLHLTTPRGGSRQTGFDRSTEQP
jgi:hypothetical protein